MIDLELFKDILSMDSTSGSERTLAEMLYRRLDAPCKELMEVGDGTLNLLLKWGDKPSVVFCTHMDTVPPFIAPSFENGVVRGRGANDAKGQLIALYTACKELEKKGHSGFALLIVSGEETGSWGAKAASHHISAPLLVIGEPTGNTPVSASKGTKSYDLRFEGVPFHSGYPEHGRSAVDMWLDFMVFLRSIDFPEDPMLGKTTWNVGLVKSDNPQNILSPALTCRLYFRTTFASDSLVQEVMRQQREGLSVTERGGDEPREYFVPEGFEGRPVAFGSDAPHLKNFDNKTICGPGSILTAHRDDEFVTIAELEQAVQNYIRIYEGNH